MTEPKLKTLDQESSILRVIYYGDPGVGKTTAAASMAELGKIIYIDAEEGLKGAALKRHGVPIENIEPHRDISYEALTKLASELPLRLNRKDPPIGLVWDSITASVGALLAELTTAAAERAKSKGIVRASYTAQQDDWGDVVAQVRELMRKFRSLPIHLVMTAHAKRGTDEDGRVRVGPATSPALQTDLMAYTDSVVMMRVEEIAGEPYRVGLCQPEGKYDAKDRIGLFPARLVEPTFPRMLAYVAGDLDRATDPVQTKVREALNTNTGEDTNAQAD